MNAKRLEDIRQQVYWAVFNILDAQPEIAGMQAGYIATTCECETERLLELYEKHDSLNHHITSSDGSVTL